MLINKVKKEKSRQISNVIKLTKRKGSPFERAPAVGG